MKAQFIEQGMTVMVKSGPGEMPIVFLGQVLGLREGDSPNEKDPTYWLRLATGPGVTLEQMYKASEIIGVPAFGLHMPGSIGSCNGATKE